MSLRCSSGAATDNQNLNSYHKLTFVRNDSKMATYMTNRLMWICGYGDAGLVWLSWAGWYQSSPSKASKATARKGAAGKEAARSRLGVKQP
jgi:hypothetical protein